MDTDLTITAETTGQKVFLLRKQRGLLQRKLADQLGMTRNRLSKIERDRGRRINVDEAAALERVLGVPQAEWTRRREEEEGE